MMKEQLFAREKKFLILKKWKIFWQILKNIYDMSAIFRRHIHLLKIKKTYSQYIINNNQDARKIKKEKKA